MIDFLKKHASDVIALIATISLALDLTASTKVNLAWAYGIAYVLSVPGPFIFTKVVTWRLLKRVRNLSASEKVALERNPELISSVPCISSAARNRMKETIRAKAADGTIKTYLKNGNNGRN